ncbi:MAG: hypothetical protein NC206_06615 [Bacteroides sp.]|nr:hypothetical protein [Roseburia sp.]MCM1346742.1 hypothetical protein [Bacteroides sp.]MCM1420182.1 hypothetical protein [Bacteroides sp.]
MNPQKAYLTYALNSEGDLVHIDSVENGKNCGCFCPHCKSKLCAKNGGTGEKRTHHFAHLSGADCVGAVESALHKMAKNVMKETLCIQLPTRFDGKRGEQLRLDRVEVEFYDKETQLRPDCIGYYGEKVIWIEFKHSHAVDTKKKGKIISTKIDCVELDINECKLEPEAVRKFITEDTKHRIWIRDTGFTPIKSGNDSNYDFDDSWCYGDRQNIQRVFAKDENGGLVNLLDDKVDMNIHSYYCVACGKELTIDVNRMGAYSFVHIDENVHCADDLYLHKAAKEVIHHRFCTKDDFTILVPQYLKCIEKDDCRLYQDNVCCARRQMPYNLKDYGYTECLIDYKLPGFRFKCDLVIKNENDTKESIIFCINAGDCHIDVNTEKFRVIEVQVDNASVLQHLHESPIGEYDAAFLNFKDINGHLVPHSDIERVFLKFSLFSSGKYYVDACSCANLEERKLTTIKEFRFLTDENDRQGAKYYSLLKCYEQNLNVCLCEICWFLAQTSSFCESVTICKRYKTKGTPHYPLKEMPINCPYFKTNKELVNRIKVKYANVKVEEFECGK